MRAFVAGATGHTGREVVRAAVAAGFSVVAHIRPDSAKRDHFVRVFEELGASVDTTPWQADSMVAALRAASPDVVFALLGTTRARTKAAERKGSGPETYETVDYGLTVMLLDAARSLAEKPKFIYLSAAGTGSSSSAYYAARERAEAAVRGSGLPFVIARPSFIVGERDEGRPLERWGARISDGALRAAGWLGARKMRNQFRSTTNVELGRALVRLAGDPAARAVVADATALR